MAVTARRRRRTVRRRPVRRPEHSVLNSRGGSREWSRITAEVIKAWPLCWLRLPGCTLRSTSADHVQLRKTHPHLTTDMRNLRGACLHCNTARRDTPVWKLPELRASMARRYATPKRPKALGFFD